ncbi:DNA alkylation repair protein [Roseibium porphyridii]|uniref:DNA alkylation repair protein n=1 Tax=Roseibium porphyridii TaxID=2866279 RepID=A0ABY8FAN3_9HYPH|nr:MULTISPECIES: DNA alkylation repair protein [Stappiaceae]QFT31194.1 DNA alkylation repair enzyme [Labrenzia sp. THAF82]WFE91804.1 DNA alkylation repair protein [Roseibium sp. KMA01]
MNTPIDDLYQRVVLKLRKLGEASPYGADANEPDPRYLGYGVRAPEMKRVLSALKTDFSILDDDQKICLAKRLIFSGYGEQKTVALALLERIPAYFSPDRFDLLEDLIRGLHGWSKIDAYTGALLSEVLKVHKTELLELLVSWNGDDDLWLRRASVVTFTRKVAKSGLYKDVALANCNALINDPEHLVQTGVGWCLRDLMRWHKEEVLNYVIGLRRNGISSTITLYALRDIKGAERQAVFDQSA